MEWAQILVIILSVFLALFLLLSIVLIALLISVTRKIRSVTGTAERAALKFEGVVSNMATFSSPVAVAKLVASFVKKAKKSKK